MVFNYLSGGTRFFKTCNNLVRCFILCLMIQLSSLNADSFSQAREKELKGEVVASAEKYLEAWNDDKLSEYTREQSLHYGIDFLVSHIKKGNVAGGDKERLVSLILNDPKISQQFKDKIKKNNGTDGNFLNWRKGLIAKLKEKHPENYNQFSLKEIAEAFAKQHEVNIVLDRELDQSLLLNIKVKGLTLEESLNILKQKIESEEGVEIKWSLKNGCIYMGSVEREDYVQFGEDQIAVSYDVRSLIYDTSSFEGYSLDSSGHKIEEIVNDINKMNGDDLVDLLRSSVNGDNVGVDDFRMEIRNGVIRAWCSEKFHLDIRKLLAELEAKSIKQIISDIRIYKLPNILYREFAELNDMQDDVLNVEQGAYLDQLNQDKNYCVERVRCRGLNNQKVTSGIVNSQEYIENYVKLSSGEIAPKMATALWGFSLDLRPVLSLNNTTIKSNIMIAQTLLKEMKVTDAAIGAVYSPEFTRISHHNNIVNNVDDTSILGTYQEDQETYVVLVDYEVVDTSLDNDKYIRQTSNMAESFLKESHLEELSGSQAFRIKLEGIHKETYEQKALKDVVNAISKQHGVKINVGEDIDSDQVINLLTKNICLYHTLNVMTDSMASERLWWGVKNDIIYIVSSKEKLHLDTYIKNYDIRQLISTSYDYAGNHFNISRFKDNENQIDVETFEAEDKPISGDEFIDLIYALTGEENWEFNKHIECHNGTIVVNNTVAIHKKIAQILQSMESRKAQKIKTSIKIWKLPVKNYRQLRNMNKECSYVLNSEQLKFLRNMEKEKKAKFINQIQCTALNCFRVTESHVSTKSYIASYKKLATGESIPQKINLRWGLSLDVRPISLVNDELVRNDIRLTQSLLINMMERETTDGAIFSPVLKKRYHRGDIILKLGDSSILSCFQDGDDVVVVVVKND